MSNADVWKRYKAQSDAIDLVPHPEYQAVFKAAMEAADALRRCILHDHSQSAWAQPAFEAVLDTIRLAHPAADAPPSPAGVSDETRCECGEIINPGDMVYLSIDGSFLHAECCGDEDSFVDFETGEPPKIAPQPFRYES